MLTDLLCSVLIAPHLIVDLIKYVREHGVIVKITVDLCSSGIVFCLESNAVNTEHIILQGSSGNGLLCVFDIGGDAEQIPCSYRAGSLAEEKVALPFQYEEDL